MRTPKATDHAMGWPKLLRDVKGMRVRLKREAQNGSIVVPAGTIGELGTTGTGWHLLEFRSAPCTCCGVAVRITRMSWTAFDPIQ